MKIETKTQIMAPGAQLPFEVVSLVLQGGGALGAYQAGVYEALAEAGIYPNWIAGISIGAINAAIIAGNSPASRVDRLREFWTQVTSGSRWPWFEFGPSNGDHVRNLMNVASANLALTRGRMASSWRARSHHGCSRPEPQRRRASSIPVPSSARWSAWWISIV
jgi:NTE family protein